MSEKDNPLSTETFIRERHRGRKQGEKELLARLGVTTEAELQKLLAAARELEKKPVTTTEQAAAEKQAAKETPKRADETSAEHQKRLDEAVDAKIEKLIEAKLAPLVKAVDKFTADASERDARQKESAEEAAAEAAEAKRIKRFERVATAAGAKPEKVTRLRGMFDRLIEEMDEDEREEKFGKGVSAKDQEANIKKLLAEQIQPDAPGLFVPPKDDKGAEKKVETEAKTTGATDPAKPAAEQKVSTTGAAAVTDVKTTPSAATGTPFSVEKLTKAQFREYEADPKGYRERYIQGQIAQPAKTAAS